MSGFRNHPLLELRRAEQREELVGALAGLDRELPLNVPAIVSGRRIDGDREASIDPCAPERIVAR